MEIWLLRHAAAEDRAATGRDADRALTSEGRDRAEAVARGLASLEPRIAAVWTSPYRRAVETGRPAARALGLEETLRKTRSLEPARPPEDVLEEVRAEGLESVLLVGHEPHLGELLARLVACAGSSLPMKKASVARVDLDGGGRGTLRALFPASALEALGRRGRKTRRSPG